MPDWVKETLDHWLSAADIKQGKLFRRVCRKGTVWGTEITEKVVWHVVKEYAGRLGISKWPRSQEILRPVLSRLRWRIRADPILVGSRLGADDGEILCAESRYVQFRCA
jgi:hypothetical protein